MTLPTINPNFSH